MRFNNPRAIFFIVTALVAAAILDKATNETPDHTTAAAAQVVQSNDPAPDQAQPTLRFPNKYELMVSPLQCAPRYFHCDATTGMCMKGRQSGPYFAGVMLAPDRRTVVAHLYCDDRAAFCLNFDTGQAVTENRSQQWLQNDNVDPSSLANARNIAARCEARNEQLRQQSRPPGDQL